MLSEPGGEAKLRSSEASMREAYEVEQRRLAARIESLRPTEEEERAALVEQQAALEAELRKQLEETAAQAARDAQAQQMLIDVSKAQADRLQKQYLTA